MMPSYNRKYKDRDVGPERKYAFLRVIATCLYVISANISLQCSGKLMEWCYFGQPLV